MKNYLLSFLTVFFIIKTQAHPMPGSLVELYIMNNCIRGEARIPLIELGNAVGDDRILNLDDPFFQKYFSDHIRASNEGECWITKITSISSITKQDAIIGKYKATIIDFTLTPKNKNQLRKFTFNYDAVIHQVITHSAIVCVKQDWENGIISDKKNIELGVIKLDVPSGKIFPLEINLVEGTLWKGFKEMVRIGTKHIQEGTDHLLFLIVLLIPSMLLSEGRKWSKTDKNINSIFRLIKIVTAFTLGHSLTLLIGSLGWFNPAPKLVEILIAISILVSAIHALYPVFAGKEHYVAAGFGLVHGLAFATVLSGLQLEKTTFALSILGFNVGIEIMQLFIIGVNLPWLFILSKTPFYNLFRIAVAYLSILASIAWVLERTIGFENSFTVALSNIPQNGLYITFIFALISIFGYCVHRFSHLDEI